MTVNMVFKRPPHRCHDCGNWTGNETICTLRHDCEIIDEFGGVMHVYFKKKGGET
jgi:hypothetical protein